jgi:hypothetical protein
MNVNESFLIGTTRFNNDTYQENLDWRNKHKHSGCIYPLNKSIAYTIPPNILICVLEMNNSQNKIMGIGLIRNSYDMRQSIKVYNSDLNYNNFPWPKIYSMKDNSENIKQKFISITDNENNLIYYYSEGKECMYSNSPCSNYYKENILLKIKEGYSIYYLKN